MTKCEKCGGTGWIKVIKGDLDFVKKCDCLKTNILLTTAEKANIPTRFIGSDLQWSYQPDKDNPSQVKAKNQTEKLIKNYPAIEKGILFTGPVGVGKTTLLCSIAFELLKRSKPPDLCFIDWNDLVRQMRSGEPAQERDFKAINDLIERLCEVELLIFDEIGASRVSPWVFDNIYFVFNKRYNFKRHIICASNYNDNPTGGGESLRDRIGERIRSRLLEMTTHIEIKGQDFRRKL